MMIPTFFTIVLLLSNLIAYSQAMYFDWCVIPHTYNSLHI